MDKIWTRDFVLVSMANFFVAFIFYMILMVLAVYVMHDLGASPAEAGLAVGIFLVAALTARLISGRLIEDVGRTRLMCIGVIIFLVGTVLYPLANSIEWLYLVRAIHGAGFGTACTALGTIATILVPRDRQGEGLGYFLLSLTLASAVGPLVGMTLYNTYGMSPVFYVAIVIAVISYLLARAVKTQPPIPLHERKVKAHGWQAFIEPSAVPIAIVAFFLFVAYASIVTFFSAYMIEIDHTEVGAIFFLVYSVSIIITRPFTGKWGDKHGLSSVLYPSFVIFAVALFLLSIASQAYHIIAAAICMGVGFGAFIAAGQTRAISELHEERIGVATTTYLAIAELGTGFGPFFFGVIVPIIGYSGIYTLSTGICLFAGVLYYFFYTWRKSTKKSA